MDSMSGFGPFGAGSNPVGGTRIYKEKRNGNKKIRFKS